MPKNAHSRRTRTDGGSPLSAFNAAFLQWSDARKSERQRRAASSESRRQEINEQSIAFEADRERRKALGSQGRIAEDSEAFSSAIKNTPEATLVLQVNWQPTSRHVWCRARDCLKANSDSGSYGDIQERYRMAVFLNGRDYPEYYHVVCVEALIPLAPLAGSQFILDDGVICGLLLGKWLEHQGRINIEKIVAYIDRVSVWSTRYSEIAEAFDTIDLEHSKRCTRERPSCGCSKRPKSPKVPVLKNYVADEGCALWKILSHPYAQRERHFDDAHPPWRFDASEDLESDSDPCGPRVLGNRYKQGCGQFRETKV